jgi:hypothetical protein
MTNGELITFAAAFARGRSMIEIIAVWPWLPWAAVALVLVIIAVQFTAGLVHGHRAYDLGFDDGLEHADEKMWQRGYEAGENAGYRAGRIDGAPPVVLDDTIPGWPSARHAEQLEERLTTTGEIALETTQVQARLFLDGLDLWEAQMLDNVREGLS